MTEPTPRDLYRCEPDPLKMSDLEAAFLTRWRQLAQGAPEPVHDTIGPDPNRGWRFDWAWPGAMVAVECQGGTYTGGRHVRGRGYRADCEKHNAALEAGWCDFWCTSDMLEDDPLGFVEMVRAAVLG